MATLTIRNLPDAVRDKLRVRAAEKGRSMEAEARDVLTAAVESRVGAATDRAARDRVRRAQNLVAKYIPPGSYTVDDFLVEKRAEVGRENDRWKRLEREAAAARKSRAQKP